MPSPSVLVLWGIPLPGHSLCAGRHGSKFSVQDNHRISILMCLANSSNLQVFILRKQINRRW